MVLYEAHGAKDACGPGCSEWIAAEGEIVAGSGNQLQRLLVRLNGARLPIFFDSPGGSVSTSIALGQVIRARQLTVSVGRTVPLDCDPDATGEKSCEAKISAGEPIEAELDPGSAMCNSGCVVALADGAVRLIPPGVTLGIHDVGFGRSHPNWRAETVDAEMRGARARLQNYIRAMGIDSQLLDEAFAIPNASLGQLSATTQRVLGLDRREFGETVWRFRDKRTPAIEKLFFVRTQSDAPHCIDGLVTLSCGRTPSLQYVLRFVRNLLPTDASAPSAQAPVGISVSNRQFNLSRQKDPNFYLRSTQLAPAALDGIADAAAITLPGTEFGREAGPAGDIALAMDGFPAAYANLQKACTQPGNAAPADAPGQRANATRPPEPDLLAANLPVGSNPNANLRNGAIQEGLSR
jgi:hypothetical protein